MQWIQLDVHLVLLFNYSVPNTCSRVFSLNVDKMC